MYAIQVRDMLAVISLYIVNVGQKCVESKLADTVARELYKRTCVCCVGV